MKLSDAQAAMLAEVFTGPLTEVDAMLFSGRGWRRTARALTNRGLIVFRPHALKGESAFKITPAGRAKVARMLTGGQLVKD